MLNHFIAPNKVLNFSTNRTSKESFGIMRSPPKEDFSSRENIFKCLYFYPTVTELVTPGVTVKKLLIINKITHEYKQDGEMLFFLLVRNEHFFGNNFLTLT